MTSACRPSSIPDDPGTPPELLGPGVYRVSTGERLELDELTEGLLRHRFVIVGESHDDLWHHEVQRRVYEALVQSTDGPVALGMEMFQQPYQDVLDAYVAGDLDEDAMLEGTRWSETWGFDRDFYAAKWRLAREKGYPVVALNLPREVVRAVGRGGLDSLDDEVRAGLPEMDLSNDGYRTHLRAIFTQHGMDDETRLEFFYQAQVLWDEAMAERAVDFMTAYPEIPHIVLLAGRGHVERGWGIPARIARRVGGADDVVTIIPVTIDSEHQQTNRDLAALQREAVSDYVWIGP